MVNGKNGVGGSRFGEVLSGEWSARRFLFPLAGAALAGTALASVFLATGVPSWPCFALGIAAFASVGYVLGREEDRLTEMVAADPLTGLHSPGFLQQRQEAEMKRIKQLGSLALVIFDVDKLSAINRHHGEDQGNRVLRAVAAAIRAQLRGSDVAARWGEDEFVVLLPTASAEGARHFADRVRQRLSEHHHALTVRIETTFGVADLTAETDILSEGLLLAAARDLRRAKLAKTPPLPAEMSLSPTA